MKTTNTIWNKQLLQQIIAPAILSIIIILVGYLITKPAIQLICKIDTELQNITLKVLLVLFSIIGCMFLLLLFVIFNNYRNLQNSLLSDIDRRISEARFEGLVEHIDDGILIFENDKPVFANGQFKKIFGINNDDILNFDLENYLPDSEKERVKIIRDTTKQKQITDFFTWLLLSNKQEKYVHLGCNYNTETNINFKYLVIQDQTEKKRSLTTIEILSENLTQSPQSVIITDLNGAIEYTNPIFEKITGYSFEEVKGKNPRLLNSNKMSPLIYGDLWKTISGGEIWRGELLNKKKDGTLFWESTIIFPIKNKQNEIIKYSSIKTDISHNKQIEQELIAARDRAEENEHFKTAFLNNVSHEIRTPLNAIYGFTEILKENFEKDEEVLNYLKIIEKNSQILLHLFDDIIDVSSIESGSISLKKEDVPVKDLLLKIVTKYNVQLTILETKPVEIIIDEDNNFETMVLFTDRKRISQIFDKLLSNSVKFTKKGHIKISYDIYPENITFHISDTGIGIPDKESQIIFNSFSHGEQMFVGLHKGVGLGLNIVKLLVELLGGQLTFISDETKGTTFSFTFPTTDLKNYRIDGKNVNSYKKSLNNKNILIAEDNDENFKYLENLLAPRNNIIRAKTGIEVLDLLNKGNITPDIILMDILMPEMNGIIASKLIKKTQPTMPILAITPVGLTLTDQEKTIFDAILPKPISGHLLVNKIYETLMI